jgi:hypothetical protein
MFLEELFVTGSSLEIAAILLPEEGRVLSTPGLL